MGFLDRILRSPADRRLAEAEAAAEVWASAPKPAAPGTGIAVRAVAPRTPAIGWTRDQPPAPPSHYQFQGGYSDHTYQQFGAPLGFEGFGLERIRNAVTLHRLGNFFESSALMVAILGFAPVLAALQQAIAPILALSRHVHGGDTGLALHVAREVEAQIVPRGGLLPSPYLPPTLWGTMAIYLRMLGFCVLQHVDGDPDPVTGVRPRFTRIWEPWALTWTRSPRKLIAHTTDGPVEITNDGKFTLVADEQEPYLSAAICALGEEAFGGKITQEARNSFLDFFGKPKLWASMPPAVATGSQAGNDFFAAVETIYGPDGFGVLPNGSSLDAVSISGEGSKGFQDALIDAIIHIYMVLTGSAGTIGAGGATGAGPYQPQKGGVWNVLHHHIARPTIAIVRSINAGHVEPYCYGNYAEGIAEAKSEGTWKDPVLEVPVPAPDRDERLAADISRYKAFAEQVKLEQEIGAPPDQDRVEKLASVMEVQSFRLRAPSPITKDDMAVKTFSPDEYRAARGYPALPNKAGSVERLAEERLAGGDEPGALVKAGDDGEAGDVTEPLPGAAAPPA